jgi:transposase
MSWSRSIWTPQPSRIRCRWASRPTVGRGCRLLAAGYGVFAINPLQVARYRERHSPSGAKSDPGDAHLLAEIVRLDRAHHRRIAGDSEIAEHVKIAARAHQSMI